MGDSISLVKNTSSSASPDSFSVPSFTAAAAKAKLLNFVRFSQLSGQSGNKCRMLSQDKHLNISPLSSLGFSFFCNGALCPPRPPPPLFGFLQFDILPPPRLPFGLVQPLAISPSSSAADNTSIFIAALSFVWLPSLIYLASPFFACLYTSSFFVKSTSV